MTPRPARLAALATLSALAALAACETPPLKIAFQVSGGPVQACPATSMSTSPTCSDVPMLCDAVLDIRIVRPSNPQHAYLQVCEDVPISRDRDLCSIASVDLPSSRLPKETLEVQVMIWPRDAVKADLATGELDCREIYGQPLVIGFGVHGFPEETTPSPALGGRAFYHPGDEQTVVTLGCSDLPAVNRPVCFGAGGLEISAAVNQFEKPTLSVPPSQVAGLAVSVGEPRSDGEDGHRMERTYPLALPDADIESGQDPTWSAVIPDPDIERSMCIQVLASDGPATVRCDRIAATERRLDVTGFWLPSPLWEQILAGIGFHDLPPEGLTLGVVLDTTGRPASGFQVTATPDSPIDYLTPTYEPVVGGTATTSSGLFVMRTAPYDTELVAKNATSPLEARGLGGRVAGRVTIVVLQLAPQAEP